MCWKAWSSDCMYDSSQQHAGGNVFLHVFILSSSDWLWQMRVSECCCLISPSTCLSVCMCLCVGTLSSVMSSFWRWNRTRGDSERFSEMEPGTRAVPSSRYEGNLSFLLLVLILAFLLPPFVMVGMGRYHSTHHGSFLVLPGVLFIQHGRQLGCVLCSKVCFVSGQSQWNICVQYICCDICREHVVQCIWFFCCTWCVVLRRLSWKAPRLSGAGWRTMTTDHNSCLISTCQNSFLGMVPRHSYFFSCVCKLLLFRILFLELWDYTRWLSYMEYAWEFVTLLTELGECWS